MGCIAKVDEMDCAGHGDCALAAPGVFAVDDVARVVGTAPRELLIEAAESCPAGAISVFDDASGERIYP
ncbi:MAG: ferredoxin [Thermoleophilaceae bacterium]|jgi:ferredoxin|nr:ferredoxin [Thermoleophilaceae bacterium]